jgi:hypothetical protein
MSDVHSVNSTSPTSSGLSHRASFASGFGTSPKAVQRGIQVDTLATAGDGDRVEVHATHDRASGPGHRDTLKQGRLLVAWQFRASGMY